MLKRRTKDTDINFTNGRTRPRSRQIDGGEKRENFWESRTSVRIRRAMKHAEVASVDLSRVCQWTNNQRLHSARTLNINVRIRRVQCQNR